MKCEICGKTASTVCPRCYRYICEHCTDPITLYCIDCSSFKKWQEEDYIRYINSLSNKINYMIKIFGKKECMVCPLYKDSVMSSLRKVKELEQITKLEDLERAYEEVVKIKESIQKLAIEYLIKYVKSLG